MQYCKSVSHMFLKMDLGIQGYLKLTNCKRFVIKLSGKERIRLFPFAAQLTVTLLVEYIGTKMERYYLVKGQRF